MCEKTEYSLNDTRIGHFTFSFIKFIKVNTMPINKQIRKFQDSILHL